MSTGPKGQKYLVAMVGLPARGKTYTARKLAGYLSWLGYPTRVFNVGVQRRATLGPLQRHGFFDPANEEGQRQRHALAMEVLDEALHYLEGDARVAIFDATNSTRERRRAVRERCREAGRELVFIEVVNNDPAVVEANVRETKLSSPDYAGMDPDAAVADFRARLAHYERSYQPVLDGEGPLLRIIDRGRRVEMSEIDGYLASRIVFFLTNLQVSPRPLLMTRHGESEYNRLGRIGGDSPLSPRGKEYARRLARAVNERFAPDAPLELWTSTLRRTLETAEAVGRESVAWRSLNEIDAGVCDGLTYEEIASQWPREFEARGLDKLRYRYPRGESYEDVIQRVDRVIIEAERQRTPVLVIAHQAVLRALYSYFMGLPPEDTPHVPVPLHTLIELTPRAYGCDEVRFELGPEAAGSSSST